MPIVLTPSVAVATATKSFASMVPDVSAFLRGCPDLVIERTLRKMATDLCQRAKVWVVDTAPIAVVVDTFEYAATSPLAHGEVCDIKSGYTVDADDAKVDLRWLAWDKVRRAYPSWPQNASGRPSSMTTRYVGAVSLAPVPDTTLSLYLRVVLRPTATATVWQQWLYDEFHRVLFHGTLYELMMMPGRSWTDEKAAALHGKQWTALVANAAARAEREFNIDSVSVEQIPFA